MIEFFQILGVLIDLPWAIHSWRMRREEKRKEREWERRRNERGPRPTPPTTAP